MIQDCLWQRQGNLESENKGMAMASNVYFTNLRTGFNNSLLYKLRRVMEKAGFGDIDFEDHYAAIKLHFGEPGNLAFLRPNWAKVVADEVKKRGGKPFLTDCNTLYVGGRKNALDHMDTAMENGFSPLSTGCQYTRQKSEEPSWMQISSSRSIISRAMRLQVSEAR